MTDEESEGWTCPSCGAKYGVDVRQCPSCRVSRIHRASGRSTTVSPPGGTRAAKQPEMEVKFPLYLPEARFSIVVPGGGAVSWTSGLVYVTTNGIYALSQADGFDSEAKAAEAAKEAPDAPKRFAPLSVYLPKGQVKRLVHGQFIGNFMEMAGLKIPLRLSNDGWKIFMAACRKLEIKVET